MIPMFDLPVWTGSWRRLIVVGVIAGVVVVADPAAAGAGVVRIARVSVSSAGAQAFTPSESPSISADGRYVAFESQAPLVPDDTNGMSDVYVRDRAAGTTTRVSVRGRNGQLDASSGSPKLSAQGRYVAFSSHAANLVPGDTNDQPDIFVRDLVTGATSRANVSAAGAQANEVSFTDSISADGRYVAFTSSATNLVPDDTNDAADVFVRDQRTGAVTRVFVPGDQDDGSEWAMLSAGGRYVVFNSDVDALTDGIDVHLMDLVTGATERIDMSSAGAIANDGSDLGPAISGNGRYVTFSSRATNLVPGDTNTTTDVFVRDRLAGTTRRVSLSPAGVQANGPSGSATISADGRYVAFSTAATNLVPGDTNDTGDVLVRDQRTGALIRASLSYRGKQPNDSVAGALSADGRHVVLVSPASNLVPHDTNGVTDVFTRTLYPQAR